MNDQGIGNAKKSQVSSPKTVNYSNYNLSGLSALKIPALLVITCTLFGVTNLYLRQWFHRAVSANGMHSPRRYWSLIKCVLAAPGLPHCYHNVLVVGVVKPVLWYKNIKHISGFSPGTERTNVELFHEVLSWTACMRQAASVLNYAAVSVTQKTSSLQEPVVCCFGRQNSDA